jgi:hypothetical protein
LLLDSRNIWSFGRESWVVVWANVGFKEHKGYQHPFEAIVTTDSARQAVALDRTNELRYAWARHCCAHTKGTPHMRYPLQDAKVAGVMMVPTKPIVEHAPWQSWLDSSDPVYFEQQVPDLCHRVEAPPAHQRTEPTP